MGWPNRLTTQQKQDLIRMYESGYKVQVIAERFNVHHSYPALLARRMGLPTRAGLTNRRYPDEQSKKN